MNKKLLIKENEKGWTERSGHILEHATSLDRYNRWLVGNFKGFLNGKILEVGAGLGGLAKLLPQQSLTLSDHSPEYIKFLKKEFGVNTLLLDIEKDAPVKYHNNFDTILSSNVFEHINSDQNAFNNCYKLLKKSGHLLLFVPARPEIFSSLDQDMGHLRRYTLSEIKQKALKAGFVIVQIKYANLPGYFTWWGRGVLLGKLIKTKSDKSSTDSLLAKIFDIFITPLLHLEKYYNPPFGQSLILIAKKA